MSAVPLRVAARAMGVAEPTVRAWVREGAPTARLGSAGRGRGTLVVVADLQAWRVAKSRRGADTAEMARRLAPLFRDYHRGGDHRLIRRWDDAAAARYLAAIFEYVALRWGLPEEEVDAIDLFPANRSPE